MKKIIAGIQFTEDGIAIIRPYVENPQLCMYDVEESLFTGEFLEVSKRLVKSRMAHCFKSLHSNITNATHITEDMIAWKGGRFNVRVWKELEKVLDLKDARDLNQLQVQQILRSILLHNQNWVYDYDENWNQCGKDMHISEKYKVFITEMMVVANQGEY